MKLSSKLVQERLTELGEPRKARWLENYIKHDVRSRGVPMAKIRNLVRTIEKEYGVAGWKFTEQCTFLTDLMSQVYTEDKIFVVLYLQMFWNGQYHAEKLELIGRWFDAAWISDWNVCDWLCLKVLTPILHQKPELTIEVLKVWNRSKTIWKARASLVPFAQFKPIIRYKSIIEAFSINLIQRPDRFCKTAVGWVLREYSKFDSSFVTQFLEDYQVWTTSEVIRNATKYIRK